MRVRPLSVAELSSGGQEEQPEANGGSGQRGRSLRTTGGQGRTDRASRATSNGQTPWVPAPSSSVLPSRRHGNRNLRLARKNLRLHEKYHRRSISSQKNVAKIVGRSLMIQQGNVVMCWVELPSCGIDDQDLSAVLDGADVVNLEGNADSCRLVCRSSCESLIQKRVLFCRDVVGSSLAQI